MSALARTLVILVAVAGLSACDGTAGPIGGEGSVSPTNGGGVIDGGVIDGGVIDGGAIDGGAIDGGAIDGGAIDGGAIDGGAIDGGAIDGGAIDGGALDGGNPFVCTRVLGFSQTQQWELGNSGYFENTLGSDQFELLLHYGAGLDDWANPGYAGWTAVTTPNCDPNASTYGCLSSPCAQRSGDPDRVILTITNHTYESSVSNWVARIQAAAATIRAKYPNLRRIVLQPVIGGPTVNGVYQRCSIANNCNGCDGMCVSGAATCTFDPDPTRCAVRASYNHPFIVLAIQAAVAADGFLVDGPHPQVQDCSYYRDGPGHLCTLAAATSMSATITSLYSANGY